jgi:hypothetical protein
MSIIKPRRGAAAPGTGTINQNELAVDTTNKRIYIGAADGSGTLIGAAPGGSDTQVQFNDSGNLGGDSGLTYNKTTDSLTITGDLAVNGGDITTSTTTASIFDATATTVNAFGAATTLNLGYDSTATSTTNISTGTVGASNIKTINIGTGAAGSSYTDINIGPSLGTSAIGVYGEVSVYGTAFIMYSSTSSPDSISLGDAKGGRKGITGYADDSVLAPITLAIDNQDGGGEIDIFGFSSNDYTVGYIKCDTPLFLAGDIVGNSNGCSIELNDNTGFFTVAAILKMASNQYIQFEDGSHQITKTPDYLLFDMGIV